MTTHKDVSSKATRVSKRLHGWVVCVAAILTRPNNTSSLFNLCIYCVQINGLRYRRAFLFCRAFWNNFYCCVDTDVYDVYTELTCATREHLLFHVTVFVEAPRTILHEKLQNFVNSTEHMLQHRFQTQCFTEILKQCCIMAMTDLSKFGKTSQNPK